MSSIDIAAWFIQNNPDINYTNTDTNIKLQKLLYYSQAMHLAVTDTPLFTERIEAWKYGPVVRDVYGEFEYNNLLEKVKNHKTTDLKSFNPLQIQILKTINFLYGTKSSYQLVDLTHQELPWKSLEPKVDRQENPEIEQQVIRDYYKPLRETFEAYQDFDFDAHNVEKIHGNHFIYNKHDVNLTDEDLGDLWDFARNQHGNSFYVYKEDGELVVYQRMNYECGTIHIRKDIKFKDGGIDTRRFGHPTVVALDTNFKTSHIYYLTMSSNPSALAEDVDREYFLLKPTRKNQLRSPSYINLKFIYKVENSFMPDKGCIDRDVFVGLMKKFMAYQEAFPDPLYNELHPQLLRNL